MADINKPHGMVLFEGDGILAQVYRTDENKWSEIKNVGSVSLARGTSTSTTQNYQTCLLYTSPSPRD